MSYNSSSPTPFVTKRQVSMNYKEMFHTIVSTNGLHAPERRRGPSGMKRLLVLILMSIGLIAIGSTFLHFSSVLT